MQVCAITGHRPSRFPFKNDESDIICQMLKIKIENNLRDLYQKGIRTFWIGGALGVDMWSSEILIELKKEEAYSDIKIMIAIPFEGYSKMWKKQYSERLNNILDNADKVVVIGTKKEPKQELYKKRNEYIVDKADCLLAVFDRRRIVRSGTHMTIMFALRKGIPIIVVDSNLQKGILY